MKLEKQVSVKSYFINLCSLLGITVLLIIYLKLTSGSGRFLFECLCKKYIHIYCPGCGGTRACYSLFNINLLDAILSNPIVPYFAGGILYYIVKMGFLLIIRRNSFYYTFNTTWIPIGGILALVFFVIRNILLIFYGIDYLGDVGQYWL